MNPSESEPGSYEVLALLGKGGMGRVYLARDSRGSVLALKVLAPRWAHHAEMRRRFRREVRIALSLDHPNLVRSVAAGQVSGQLFLASELVRGGSLSRLLKHCGCLELQHALRVARDLARGLAAIERHGMIHRDLKPQNVLLEPDGRARVADFGLARPAAADRNLYTRPDVVLGTPYYVAPEQIQPLGQRQLDIRCDLYAVGVILYRCLIGRVPYRGRNPCETLDLHVNAPVPDLAALDPALALHRLSS